MSRGCESRVVSAGPVIGVQDHAPTIGFAGLCRDVCLRTLDSERRGGAADDTSSVAWSAADMCLVSENNLGAARPLCEPLVLPIT